MKLINIKYSIYKTIKIIQDEKSDFSFQDGGRLQIHLVYNYRSTK